MSESALQRLARRLEQRRQQLPTEGVRPTLVVCDDEVRNLEALERVLGERYKVVRFTNGEAVIEAMQQGSVDPDAVLSDQRMPGMPGVVLLQKVRMLRPSCARIIVSGYSEQADLISAINQGQVHCYLHKPWNAQELIEAIDTALQEGRRHSELARLEQVVQERTAALEHAHQQLRLAQAQVAALALDPDTELPNHQAAEEFLEKELRRGARHQQPVSLLLSEVDRLNLYEHDRGFPTRKEVLRRLSNIFRARVRNIDFLARLNGGQIAAIMPQTSLEGACAMGDRIRQEFADGFSGQAQIPQLTLSVGAAEIQGAELRAQPITGEELIRRAYEALLRSTSSARIK